MNKNMEYKLFKDIDLEDKFFDSLKEDYSGFDEWFYKKGNEKAYVQYKEDGYMEGFLYLKIETEEVTDVMPIIKAKKILKVGTFKIDSHGTKLGERFIKIIMDYAINESVDICYVTIYPKHVGLIKLVSQYGFKKYGIKGKEGKKEDVYVKDMTIVNGDLNYDYPLISLSNRKKYMLSIYPKYHSIMFPDSILTNENKNMIMDVAYTNSIHKIYVCRMDVECLKYGDTVVIYRTAPNSESAEYKSVATSICVVEEVKLQSEFNGFDEFYSYASRYSVFDRDDLRYWYERGECKAIKMTYNVALQKRLIRHDLIETIGLDREQYWGFFSITDKQFMDIVHSGKINDKIIK